METGEETMKVWSKSTAPSEEQICDFLDNHWLSENGLKEYPAVESLTVKNASPPQFIQMYFHMKCSDYKEIFISELFLCDPQVHAHAPLYKTGEL